MIIVDLRKLKFRCGNDSSCGFLQLRFNLFSRLGPQEPNHR